MAERVEVQVVKLEGSPLAERGKFAQAYEYSPPEEDLLKKRGRLFAVLDIAADPVFDAALAGKLVWDSLCEEYFSESDDTPLKALEKAVLSAKNRLVNLLHSSDGLGTGERAVLDLGAAVIWEASPSGEAGVLYLARQGNPTLFLKRAGQVREFLVGNEPSSVASVVVEDGDVIILGSQDFGKSFTSANFPEIPFFEREFASGRQVPGMAATILKLKVAPEATPPGGRPDAALAEKIEEEAPFGPKTSSAGRRLPLVKSLLEQLPRKKESLPFPSDKIRASLTQMQTKAKHTGVLMGSGIKNYVGRLGQRMAESIQARISRGQEVSLERGHPVFGLSKVIAVLVLIFLLSVSLTLFRQRQRIKAEELNRLFSTAEETISEAESLVSLSSGRAGELWREAKSRLEEATAISSKDARVGALSQRLATLYNLIEKITSVTADNLFYDLTLQQGWRRALALAGSNRAIFVAEEGLGAVLSIGQTQPPQVEEATANEVREVRRLGWERDWLYLLSDETLTRYHAVSRKKETPLRFDRYAAVASFDTYNGNIYFLIPSENQIYKFLNLGAEYSGARPWLKEPSVLEGAVDLAIDGFIWVLSGDGTVARFLAGKREPFAIAGLTAGIAQPRAIYTRPTFDKLYVAESNRVLVINKDGQFERQFRGDVLSDVVDLWVSDDEKSLFILTRDKVFKVNL